MDGELVLVKGGEKVVIIPNIKGQLYMVGSEYDKGLTGPKTECILLKDVAPLHCRIRVNKEREFVLENNCGGKVKSKTVLNGKVVGKNETVKIKFGDTVTMNKVRCRFQERSYRPIIQDVIIPPGLMGLLKGLGATLPLPPDQEIRLRSCGLLPPKKDNPLPMVSVPEGVTLPWDVEPKVLSKIFEFLPVADLKRCRLVSSNWRKEATPILQEKSTIVWNFFDDTFLDQLIIFRYVREMKEWKPKILEIILRLEYSIEGMRKIEDDWDRHITTSRVILKGVKKLLIRPIFLLPTDRFWAKVCGRVAPSLEILNFHMIININPLSLPCMPCFPSITFPKMKSFKIESEFDDKNELVPWNNGLAKAIRTVEFLNLGACEKKHIINIISNPFPKLQGISIDVSEASETALHIFDQNIKTALKKIRIHISGSCVDHTKVFKGLDALLKKHANSLENLELHLSGPKEGNVTWNWRQPLPNLMRLELHVQEEEGSIRINFDGENESAAVRYTELFPNLRALKVLWSGEEQSYSPGCGEEYTVDKIWMVWQHAEHSPVLDAFFPLDSNEVLPSLQELEMPHADEGQAMLTPDAGMKADYQQRLKAIAKLFPSVKNGWLEEARGWE